MHHLLTHTSGLPAGLNCLLADPNLKFRVRYAPGEHFSYCNLAYQALGYLVWQADGRPFADAIRERILRPLKMESTEPVISGETRLREPRSYNPLLDDLAAGGWRASEAGAAAGDGQRGLSRQRRAIWAAIYK